jgi:hypothetical protein
MLLSLSCYKLASHYFLQLWSTLCTHTCHISCILLLCSAAQKTKSSSMKTSFRRACPRHLPMVWCLVPLFRPICLVISFILRLDVINTGYTVISLFVTLCVKLDPSTHKGIHSVLALKLGVTVELYQRPLKESNNAKRSYEPHFNDETQEATTLGTITSNPEMPKMMNNDDMDMENTIMEYNSNDVFGDLK